ncbi:MAG: hypothetical protein QXT43_01720, partial [Candidatus Micrarchaeaceae archaeon]
MLHRHESLILRILRENGGKASLATLIEKAKISKDAVVWAIESLAEKGAVSISRESSKSISISGEGKEYASTTLPEDELLKRLKQGPIKLSSLNSKKEQIGIKWLKSKGLAQSKDGMLIATKLGLETEQTSAEALLKRIAKGISREQLEALAGSAEFKELEARRLVSIGTSKQVREVRIT